MLDDPIECVFCGATAKTRDHVPPKCIFPDDRRINLRTVPACEICNSKTKKDDEYFRMVLATAANDSNAAGSVLKKKIFPGATVRPGLLKQINRAYRYSFRSRHLHWTETSIHLRSVTSASCRGKNNQRPVLHSQQQDASDTLPSR